MHDCEHHPPCEDHAAPAGGRPLAWAEIATLLALAAFLGYASLTGRVLAFLAPGYAWLPPSAAALLASMALARLHALRDRAACECHPSGSPALRWGLTAALLAPIVMGLALDPRQFSPQGVKRRFAPAAHDPRLERAMAWVLGAADEAPFAPVPSIARSAEPTVLELVRAADSGQAAAWAGRFVSVIGQCDLSNDPPLRRFGLYRFVVTCCIADAQLVAVDVIAPPGLSLQPRQWVRVEGVIRLENMETGGEPVIQAATVSKIPAPSSPYL
jgi:uncharacterized repeat protein (TIGR03943 family)